MTNFKALNPAHKISISFTKRKPHASRGAVLAEAAIALAIFVPIFIAFGAILISAAVTIGDRGTSASYSQSPCVVNSSGVLVDPITNNAADWCY